MAAAVPSVTAVRANLWNNTLTPAGQRVEEDQRKDIMKTVLSALVALSVIAGITGSANALDAKAFYEQVDRNHYAKKDNWTAWGGAMRGLAK
jgi:hypothetical protein